MSTIEKAMQILGEFSAAEPELGLSELRRRIGRDKATIYRHLMALEGAGLIEQHPESKRYRIGPAVLRLAWLREAAMPRRAAVDQVLPILCDATGETAHATILEGDRLGTLAVRESSRHSTRVVLDDATLPLHATASGAAVLAFGAPRLRQLALARMVQYTEKTVCSPQALDAMIADARRTGFGVSSEGFEMGVYGIAAPLFDETGCANGALAVATVAARMTPGLQTTIKGALAGAARQVTISWGGAIPAELEEIWPRDIKECLS